MRLLLNLFILWLSMVLFVIIAPIVFIIRIILFSNRADYVMTCILGIDQVGGSFLYNKINWTISGYSGYLRNQGNMFGTILAELIDFVFMDASHCENARKWDLQYDALAEIKESER